ncbi:MAG: hypothetical protein RLZZ592_98 [Pseudomonadota bacterium]|jgi:O-antigen ligase
MSPSELIFLALGGSALSAAAIVATLVFALMLHGQLRIGRFFLPMMFVCIALGMALGVLLSRRDVRFAAFGIDTLGADVAAAAWPMRLLTGLMLGMSLTALFNRYYRARRFPMPGRHPVGAGQRRFAEVFAVYFITTNLLPAVLGHKHGLVLNTCYALPVFLLAIIDGAEAFERILRWAKFSLLGMTLGSLLAWAVMPNLALQVGYSGWVPGLTVRLWGIGSSPNSIGPLALLSLLLESMSPTRHRGLRALLLGCGGVTLVMAQSKTAWMAMLVAGSVILLHRFGRDARGRLRIGTLVGLLLMAAALVLGLLVVPPHRWIEAVSDTRAGTEMVTLTGRSQIWAVALDVWMDYPLFGYGPTIWDPAFRAALGMPFATHAHNQFLQSLSQGGMLSGLSLLVYLILMTLGCARMMRATRGVSLGLLAVVLVRSLTETPLTLTTLFNGEMFTHLLVAVIAARGLAQPAAGAGR